MNTISQRQVSPHPSLGVLLNGLVDTGCVPESLVDSSISDIAIDSRQVKPGGLFLAMPGVEADGRNYIDAALDAGAGVVLYEKRQAPPRCRALSAEGRAVGVEGLRSLAGTIASRFQGEPSGTLSVTGITGTNGKTTCAWLLAQALEHFGERCAVMGTIGAGFPDDLIPSSLTTADAVSIQRNLRRWLDAGATAVCMEVSSHGLDQERVNGIRFESAVFTNLTRDHLDYHGDMATYAAAKKKLFHMPGLRSAAVNRDDPVGREILAEVSLPDVISYGLDGGDVTVTDSRIDDAGIDFTWTWNQRGYTCRSPLIGEVNLTNLLAVIATLLSRGTNPDRINQAIPSLSPPPGRMERVSGRDPAPAVLVDYAHTPDSLARALQSLRPLTRGELVVVFGCGGDRDPGKRPLMGRAAAENADRVIITNDNPRSEDPAAIAEMARAGVEESRPSADCRVELDRAAAIESAIREAAPGDVILVAGKGHESTQTIGDRVLPFSDREVATRVLEALH